LRPISSNHNSKIGENLALTPADQNVEIGLANAVARAGPDELRLSA
jgi:hypothetical protein